MKILICGAGIGGLTVATALGQQGHQVHVLERTERPEPVGAGISLQPNAMFALGTIGLDKTIQSRGYSSRIAQLRHCDGSVIRDLDFGPYVQRYGYLPLTIHRADLFDILHQSALDAGVAVTFGQTLQSFDETDGAVEVVTEQNDRLKGEVLIGADGIHSKVRVQLWGDHPVRYSGYVCWRGIVSDPEFAGSVNMNEVWGRGARFGFMPCSAEKVYWFSTKSTKDRRRPDESWKKSFKDWPQPIAQLLEATPEDRIAFNDISDRKTIYPWGRGRVTLLGDAAHPMTPNFGQGGAQAIEDAIAVSKCLSSSQNPDHAFRVYERHRHRRTKKFVDRSRRFGAIAQGGTWIARLIRNHVVTRVPESLTEREFDSQFLIEEHLSHAD